MIWRQAFVGEPKSEKRGVSGQESARKGVIQVQEKLGVSICSTFEDKKLHLIYVEPKYFKEFFRISGNTKAGIKEIETAHELLRFWYYANEMEIHAKRRPGILILDAFEMYRKGSCPTFTAFRQKNPKFTKTPANRVEVEQNAPRYIWQTIVDRKSGDVRVYRSLLGVNYDDADEDALLKDDFDPEFHLGSNFGAHNIQRELCELNGVALGRYAEEVAAAKREVDEIAVAASPKSTAGEAGEAGDIAPYNLDDLSESDDEVAGLSWGDRVSRLLENATSSKSEVPKSHEEPVTAEKSETPADGTPEVSPASADVEEGQQPEAIEKVEDAAEEEPVPASVHEDQQVETPTEVEDTAEEPQTSPVEETLPSQEGSRLRQKSRRQ
jgi:hypothetical protein